MEGGFNQQQGEKVAWQRARKSYLDAVRKQKRVNKNVLRTWSQFASLADAITATEGQDTVAVALDHVHQIMYVAVQQGAEIEKSKIRDELEKLGGYGYKYVLVGGATSGLHGEMQIVKYFLDQGVAPPKLHFAANAKGCCNCCAGMIAALDGSYESIETSPYEYMWMDPYTYHTDMTHPIFGDGRDQYIARYGRDDPKMRQ